MCARNNLKGTKKITNIYRKKHDKKDLIGSKGFEGSF